uniref:U20-Hexatoxin-Hc1j_1 n=2 Tax=Hadronyche cerberea TaxID=1107879 RepID=A0A4Q8K3F6_HADCE
MKAILSMLIFVALFAAIVGSRWNSGYGIPHKHVKLPNGKMCSLPGDSCSKRDECCKPVNEKETPLVAVEPGQQWQEDLLMNATYATWNHPCAKFSCNTPDKYKNIS